MIDFRDNNFLLFILGFAAILLELAFGVSTGFDLVIIGTIFVIAGGIGMMTQSFTIALITIIILSIAYIVLGRKYIKSKLSIETKATNVDALIGKKAKVIREILPNKPGQVKIDGEVWRAQAKKPLTVDEEVTILSVSGVTVSVE